MATNILPGATAPTTTGATWGPTVDGSKLHASNAAAVRELARGLASLRHLLLVLEGCNLGPHGDGAQGLIDGALATVGRLGVLAERTAQVLTNAPGNATQSDLAWLGLTNFSVATDGGAA